MKVYALSSGKTGFKEIPHISGSISIEWHYLDEDKASFASSVKLSMSKPDIRIIGSEIPGKYFGGQIVDEGKKISDGVYQYQVVSYEKLLRSKIWESYKNITTYKAFLKIAKANKVKTSGIFKAKKKHKSLKWKGDATVIQALRQIATLDNKNLQVRMTHNGRLKLQLNPKLEVGYVFKTGSYFDYEQSINTDKLINWIKVYGKGKKAKKESAMYQHKNLKSIAIYGTILEIISGGNITDKKEATRKGKEAWHDYGSPIYEATIELPLTEEFNKLDIDQYCAFQGDLGTRTYWISDMQLNEKDGKIYLTTAGRKPSTPDSWEYNDPDGKKVNRTAQKYASSSKGIYTQQAILSRNIITTGVPVKGMKNCNYCNETMTKNKVTYMNYCPICGKTKVLSYSGTTITCSFCKAKFCAKCGSEQTKPKRKGVLYKASSMTDVQNAPLPIYVYAREHYANGISGLLKNFFSDFWYSYYLGDKRTNSATFSSKKGNCVDLSQLLVLMLHCCGYTTAKMVYTTAKYSGKTKSYSHANVYCKINNKNYIIDPACDGTKFIPANKKKYGSNNFIGYTHYNK